MQRYEKVVTGFLLVRLFKCKHPFSSLYVEKAATIEILDEDFERVTYYFQCFKCNKLVQKQHCSLIGGVEGFMARGK